MQVKKVASLPEDPGAAEWSGAGSEKVTLAPVPIEAQPTEYARAKWATVSYGAIGDADLAVVTDGERIALRVRFRTGGEPGTIGPGGGLKEFPDAVGVLFANGSGAASPQTMGSAAAPLALWQWRENLDAPRSLVSSGPGVVRHAVRNGLGAAAAREGDTWTVVLTGALADAGGAKGGAKIGLALWDGANEERGGIGSVSAEWIALEIES